MSQTVQQAIENVNNGDFYAYFEIMDQIVPVAQRATLSQLRNKFIQGNTPYNFYQQLIVVLLTIDLYL